MSSLATAYGKQILVTVSRESTAESGAGYSYPYLRRMIRFAEWMTNERILATLSQELSCSWPSASLTSRGALSPTAAMASRSAAQSHGH
jgi:hypothetical protein